MRRRQVIVALAFALAVAAFVAVGGPSYLTLEAAQARLGELEAVRSRSPLVFAAAFGAAYAASVALSVPGALVLTLLAGALFGPWLGTLVVSLASTLGACGAFLLARTLLRDAVRVRVGPRLAGLEEGLARDGVWYLLTLRLVPLFPFVLVNLAMGLTPLRLRTYAGVSMLGMLPGTFAYVNAGSALASLESLSGLVGPRFLAAMAVLGFLPLVLRLAASSLRDARVLAPWRGRKPKRFDADLVVVGAGAGGLVAAYVGAAAKAKVVLVERHAMGGDCLNTGCVPSKAFLHAAKVAHSARTGSRFGIVARGGIEIDFGAVMAHVRGAVSAIEPHDSVERYTALGVEVVRGEARVESPWHVRADGRTLSGRAIVIASGAVPVVPPLPGLEGVDFRTSENVWGLTELPGRLAILGGGPVGCELAQGFARLGSRVTIVERASSVLSKEDADVGAFVRSVLEAEGVEILLNHEATSCEGDASCRGRGAGVLLARGPGSIARQVAFDVLVFALGRKPRVSGFGLEELGVGVRPDGTLAVDDRMRTNVPTIFACGDVAGPWQLTHAASHQAWYAAVNALAAPFKSFRVDARVMPRVTYLDPEVAHVGLNESEARARGVSHEVTRYDLADLDRAIAEGEARGFVKVLTPPGRDAILGATVVGARAGELIAVFATHMKLGKGLGALLSTVHAYPTFAEANRAVAGAWKRAHLPEGALRLAARWHAWRRG
jgi:pyruvate/2-oxoglutarate dehydrogenase complex dihydrolipoamide dehydrogenase (E3) component/uncharacterized membrane protein YdjX (TVP38/TMEM64 family)